MTWAEVRATARRLLPGVRYRRHVRSATHCSGVNRAASAKPRP